MKKLAIVLLGMLAAVSSLPVLSSLDHRAHRKCHSAHHCGRRRGPGLRRDHRPSQRPGVFGPAGPCHAHLPPSQHPIFALDGLLTSRPSPPERTRRRGLPCPPALLIFP